MKYPEHLLPQISFKRIDWHIDFSHSYLIRHTPSKQIYSEETGKIDFNLVKIQSDHLGDLSTNMLGVFDPNDNYICIKSENSEYFHDLWTEGTKVKAPNFQEDFNIDSQRGCFFLRIADIVGQIANYSNDNSDKITAKCKILHTPTNCNFWHFSIRWFSIPDQIDVRELSISKSQRKKLLSSAKLLISELAFGEEPAYSAISKKHYIKSNFFLKSLFFINFWGTHFFFKYLRNLSVLSALRQPKN
jgi:hypothetical protein